MNFFSVRQMAVLASLMAVPAAAQTPACDPIGNARGPVAQARFSIEKATAAVQSGASATRDLQDVVRALADNNTDSPLARNYLLGEAYILFLTQPGISVETTRSALGLTTNPTAAINLFTSADSAFNVVEKLAPACMPLVNEWRQHQPWANTLNAALNSLNAGALDSAEIYANRALLIERRTPYAYSVLGSVASQRKDLAKANQFWTQALAAAGSDTTYNDVRMKILFEVADAAQNAANAATGADKARLAREAIKDWQSYLTQSADDYRIAETVDRLSYLYAMAGDSASIPSVYAPMVANPAKYGENTLIHAGVAATRSHRPLDAIKLFEAVRTMNPYSRDALYNLALMYFGSDQPAKMMPLVKEIVAMDPSNPEDQLLYAYAYQSLYKSTKDAKLKKTYTDSLVYFNGLYENAPVKVAVSDFIRGDKETILGGTIENRSATAKSYTLSIEFLDKAGAVVGSQDVAIGPVAAKSTQKFRATIPKGGVYGFRYKPL